MDITPTYNGAFGRAWLMPIRDQAIAAGFDPDSDPTVASWAVEAQWSHPIWGNYWVWMQHLRPLVRDGKPLPDPVIHLEGATHEMMIWALNPEKPLSGSIETGKFFRMEPYNFAAQFKLPGDGAAFDIAEAAVRDIADGRLNPDTDNLRGLIARFGDSMVKK